MIKLAKLGALAIAIEITAYLIVAFILTVGVVVGIPLLVLLVIIGAQVAVGFVAYKLFIVPPTLEEP